jgi:hypothetical protein
MCLNVNQTSAPWLTSPVERLAYTVSQALETGAFPTRNKLYNAISRGDLETWKEHGGFIHASAVLTHDDEDRKVGRARHRIRQSDKPRDRPLEVR